MTSSGKIIAKWGDVIKDITSLNVSNYLRGALLCVDYSSMIYRYMFDTDINDETGLGLLVISDGEPWKVLFVKDGLALGISRDKEYVRVYNYTHNDDGFFMDDRAIKNYVVNFIHGEIIEDEIAILYNKLDIFIDRIAEKIDSFIECWPRDFTKSSSNN